MEELVGKKVKVEVEVLDDWELKGPTVMFSGTLVSLEVVKPPLPEEPFSGEVVLVSPLLEKQRFTYKRIDGDWYTEGKKGKYWPKSWEELLEIAKRFDLEVREVVKEERRIYPPV